MTVPIAPTSLAPKDCLESVQVLLDEGIQVELSIYDEVTSVYWDGKSWHRESCTRPNETGSPRVFVAARIFSVYDSFKECCSFADPSDPIAVFWAKRRVQVTCAASLRIQHRLDKPELRGFNATNPTRAVTNLRDSPKEYDAASLKLIHDTLAWFEKRKVEKQDWARGPQGWAFLEKESVYGTVLTHERGVYKRFAPTSALANFWSPEYTFREVDDSPLPVLVGVAETFHVTRMRGVTPDIILAKMFKILRREKGERILARVVIPEGDFKDRVLLHEVLAARYPYIGSFAVLPAELKGLSNLAEFGVLKETDTDAVIETAISLSADSEVPISLALDLARAV